MKHNLPLGVSAILVASLLYSGMNAIFKIHAPTLPPLPVVIFFQAFFALLLLLPFVFKDGLAKAKATMTTHRIGLHIFRACCSLLITYLLFYSVMYIPLVNALLLSNSAPLIVPFVGYLFFSEKINHKLWMPVLLGYAGVAIVLNPDSNFFNPAALLAFGSAIALAFTVQVVRKLTATDSITTITFYFLIFSTLLSGIISIPFWQPVSTAQLIIMAEIGALYFSSQYLANASMKYANPQLISSLMYSNVIYAAIISLLVWNILPSLHTVIGIILVVVGSIACIRIEHMSVKRAAQQVLFE